MSVEASTHPRPLPDPVSLGKRSERVFALDAA
jgi:hypothetical protein